MFERDTESAKRAIYFAKEEAILREAPEIATHDIVLGLTRTHYEEGSPFSMLHTRRQELRDLMNSLPPEKVPNSGFSPITRESKNPPLTRECKIALAYAAQEANGDWQYRLATYHLLRGIVRGGDSAAAALINLGWTIETLRALSIECRRSFPAERLSIKGILWYHRRKLIAIALALLSALIFYLRWQQR